MTKVRMEVREHYNTASDDEVIDIFVSCDGMWQRCKHKSLFSAIFVIAYVKGTLYGVLSVAPNECVNIIAKIIYTRNPVWLKSDNAELSNC